MIVNIGMNHETAPVELRECLAKDPESLGSVLSTMRRIPCIKEGLFLSTCNRVEALYVTDRPDDAKPSVLSLMAGIGGLEIERFSSNLYNHEDAEAIRHIFRVASSLDSMIMGEPQILGQLKAAYYAATREKTSGVVLNRLMHKAFHVAKRVRTETGISESAVSVSYAAVELAKKIFHELRGKKALLIGAGEMAELAARHLINQGISSIAVANRTFHRAVQVAGTFHGSPIAFEEIGSQLFEVDIVITSTAATDYVILYDQVKNSMRKRKNRPLFFIDIAVPRDVEPKVNNIDNVYVYDIDDLKGVIEINMAQRREEALKAERIVQEEVIKFERWLRTLDVVPTIISIKEKVECVRQAEIKKSLPHLGTLSKEQLSALDTLTLSITEKIVNDPILVLKQKTDRPQRDVFLDVTRQLFKLDKENGTDNER